jgi:hypothetical protein
MSANTTAGRARRNRHGLRRGLMGARGLRLLAPAVLLLSSVAAVTAPPAQAFSHARSGPASAARLWHPSAFGGQWVTPATGLAGPPGRGPDGTWQTEPTPNPGGRANGTLEAISCGAPRACIAVGFYTDDAGVDVTLAQLWTGTAWQTQAAPNPAGAAASQLTGISCDGPYACTASGYYINAAGVTVPLAERWNGASWRVQAVPSPATATASGFFAISCPSARACTAVGTYDNGAGQALTLAEGWNGRGWRVEATPNPAGAIAGELSAVSCISARACVATGTWEGSSFAPATLAEVWNGAGWHIQRTPSVAGATSSEFTGVSCTAAYACTASGYWRGSSGAAAALAERWDGVGWQVQSTPSPTGAVASELGAVSCTTARACTAVGAYVTSSDALVTLAEAWNGSAWAIQATPNPAHVTSSELEGVSCTSPGTCGTAGFQVGGSGVRLPLAEGWNGSAWRIHATPTPTGAKTSGLDGVSCASATACTAVGYYDNTPRTSATLAETWNGSAWAIQPTPNPAGAIGANLNGVSCPAPSACIAVGSYVYHPTVFSTRPLAESWNGSAWSLQSVPIPGGAQGGSLEAVSCTSPDACTAVGFYSPHPGDPIALAERWNGRDWTIQAAVTPGIISYLFGVACPSATACTAVGWYNTGVGDAKPLAEAWNGTSWQVQTVPLPSSSPGGAFSAISCPSASACTATGTVFGSPPGPFGAMAERWNGKAWSFQTVPNPPNATASLSDISVDAVACRSARSCVAAGNYTPGGRAQTFAEVWNGSAWSLQSIALPPGAIGVGLFGASCAAPHCVAVGAYFGPSDLPVTLAVAPPG